MCFLSFERLGKLDILVNWGGLEHLRRVLGWSVEVEPEERGLGDGVNKSSYSGTHIANTSISSFNQTECEGLTETQHTELEPLETLISLELVKQDFH